MAFQKRINEAERKINPRSLVGIDARDDGAGEGVSSHGIRETNGPLRPLPEPTRPL